MGLRRAYFSPASLSCTGWLTCKALLCQSPWRVLSFPEVQPFRAHTGVRDHSSQLVLFLAYFTFHRALQNLQAAEMAGYLFMAKLYPYIYELCL